MSEYETILINTSLVCDLADRYTEVFSPFNDNSLLNIFNFAELRQSVCDLIDIIYTRIEQFEGIGHRRLVGIQTSIYGNPQDIRTLINKESLIYTTLEDYTSALLWQDYSQKLAFICLFLHSTQELNGFNLACRFSVYEQLKEYILQSKCFINALDGDFLENIYLLFFEEVVSKFCFINKLKLIA